MNKKLHVLFLNSWYPSRVSPYNGDFIQRHAEAVSLHHQVTSLHIITDLNLKESLEITDEIINEVRTIIGYLKPTRNPLLKLYRYFKTFLSIYKKIGKIDIVHLNVIYPAGIFAIYLKWFKKKPFIISEHLTSYHKPFSSKISFIQKLISKIISKNSCFISPVSKELAESMINFGLTGNYHPIPNVVKTSIFQPNKIKTEEFIIIHISDMDKRKNVLGILNVIKKLELISNQFMFYLIGPDSNKYEIIVQKMNINQIEIYNHLNHSELNKFLNKSSVFVLFSDDENLPCVILEAFSCGVPVISTNVGGIKEYFPDNFGLLINQDEDSLLNAILKVKNSFDKASDKEMHDYVINNFSPNKICADFSSIYFKSLNLCVD